MRTFSIAILTVLLLLLMCLGGLIAADAYHSHGFMPAFIFVSVWAFLVVDPIRFALFNELRYK